MLIVIVFFSLFAAINVIWRRFAFSLLNPSRMFAGFAHTLSTG